jgi:predicted P-loop ATPase
VADPPDEDLDQFMPAEGRGEQPSNVTPFDPKRRKTKPKRQPVVPLGGWPSWHPNLRVDDRGRIINDLANVLIALRADPEFDHAVAFNEMRQHSIVNRVWPRAPEAEPGEDPLREVTDDDISRLQEWLQVMGIPRVSRETVGQAVEIIAREHRFHPVRDWLDTLIWDGVNRLEKWLFVYLGAEAEDDDAIEYVAAIGKMFLIAMVARIYEPGCQADYMLVLEGDQGVLKSSACRVLAGEWFSDSLPENISSKDARQHLRGKWLIEVSELAAFSKAEVEAFKAFITRREERYRPPFGRHDVMEKRQCLFVGTTNQDFYIKDPSGGRRFWPVRCSSIDVEGLADAREQLFAEAVQRFKRRDRWWPTAADEVKFFKPQQEKRQEDDPWHATVADWLERQIGDRFTVSQIARDCLGFQGDSRIGTAEQRRIANILKALGWKLERTKHGRFYARPARDDG